MEKAIDKYKDIIDLPHHEPKNFPRMSRYERSAQFSSFDAVTGHSEAIDEQARFVDAMIELSDDMQFEINNNFSEILSRIGTGPLIIVKYFCPDKLKDGGAYLTYTGKLKRINEIDKSLEFYDGKKISLSFIIDITEKE